MLLLLLRVGRRRGVLGRGGGKCRSQCGTRSIEICIGETACAVYQERWDTTNAHHSSSSHSTNRPFLPTHPPKNYNYTA